MSPTTAHLHPVLPCLVADWVMFLSVVLLGFCGSSGLLPASAADGEQTARNFKLPLEYIIPGGTGVGLEGPVIPSEQVRLDP